MSSNPQELAQLVGTRLDVRNALATKSRPVSAQARDIIMRLRGAFPPTDGWQLRAADKLWSNPIYGRSIRMDNVIAYNTRTHKSISVFLTNGRVHQYDIQAASAQKAAYNHDYQGSAHIDGAVSFNLQSGLLQPIKLMNPRQTRDFMLGRKSIQKAESTPSFPKKLPFKWYTGKGEYGPVVNFLDTETTGRDTGKASILSVSVLKMRKNLTTDEYELVSKYERMYYPRPEEVGTAEYEQALETHGLTNKVIRAFRREHLFQGSQFYDAEARKELLNYLDGAPTIGHNITQYDMPIILGRTLAPHESLPKSEWPVPLIDTLHIAEGTRGMGKDYNTLNTLFKVLTGKEMEEAVGAHHGSTVDTAANVIVYQLMERLPGRMGAIVRYLNRHMTGMNQVLGTAFRDSMIKDTLTEIVMENGLLPPGYADENQARSQQLDQLVQIGMLNKDGTVNPDFAEMTKDELDAFQLARGGRYGGGAPIDAAQFKRFVDAAVSIQEQIGGFAGAAAYMRRTQRTQDVARAARAATPELREKTIRAMGYGDRETRDMVHRANDLAQAMAETRAYKNEDIPLITPEGVIEHGVNSDVAAIEMAEEAAQVKERQLRSVWGDQWIDKIAQVRSNPANLMGRQRTADWEKANDKFAWLEPGEFAKGYGQGNAWQRALYKVLGGTGYRGDEEGLKRHIDKWQVGDISGSDHRIHQEYIDDTDDASKALSKFTKALEATVSGVKAFGSAIGSSHMYNFDAWRQTAVQQYNSAWDEAQPLFAGPLKYLYSPLRRFGQAASLNLQTKWDRTRATASVFGSIASGALTAIGSLAGGPVGGIVGAGAGATINGISQIVGNYGQRRIQARGEEIRNTINTLGGFVELVAIPFRLLSAATHQLLGAFRGLRGFMRSGFSDMANLGLPLTTLTGVGYPRYQSTTQADRLFHMQRGATNAAYEQMALAGQGLFTLGQVNQAQLIGASMLGQFNNVYGTTGDSATRYGNMVNSLYQRLSRESPQQRARTMYLASQIDSSLPARLQQMLNLGISDYNAFTNGTWEFTDPITGKKRSRMMFHGLSNEEKNRFDITQYEWGIAQDQFSNSRMRITSLLWDKFGKGLTNGLNEVLDMVASRNYSGAWSRLKSVGQQVWSTIKEALQDAGVTGDLKEWGKELIDKLMDALQPMIPKALRFGAQLVTIIGDVWSNIFKLLGDHFGAFIDTLAMTRLDVKWNKKDHTWDINLQTPRGWEHALQNTEFQSLGERSFRDANGTVQKFNTYNFGDLSDTMRRLRIHGGEDDISPDRRLSWGDGRTSAPNLRTWAEWLREEADAGKTFTYTTRFGKDMTSVEDIIRDVSSEAAVRNDYAGTNVVTPKLLEIEGGTWTNEKSNTKEWADKLSTIPRQMASVVAGAMVREASDYEEKLRLEATLNVKQNGRDTGAGMTVGPSGVQTRSSTQFGVEAYVDRTISQQRASSY